MFEQKYKNAVDKIKPSQESLGKTLSAMNSENKTNKNFRSVVRILAIASLCAALICTTIFSALKVSDLFNTKYTNEQKINQNLSSNLINPDIPTELNGLKSAENYEQVYSLLNKLKNDRINIYSDSTLGMDFEEVMEEESPDGAVTKPSAGTNEDIPDHSETNNQVSGVQEADIVKTDGKYIYYCNTEDKYLYITEVSDGQMKICTSLSLSDNTDNISEMLLIEDRLVIIGYEYGSYEEKSTPKTVSVYYDISDKSQPKKLNTLFQDGTYKSSRAVDGIVYIISTENPYYYYYYAEDFDTEVIPEVTGGMIAPQDILIPNDNTSPSFTVVTSYNTSGNNTKHNSSIAVMGSAGTIYSAKENIYITHTRCNEPKEGKTVYDTCIYRIALNNGQLTATGAGYIPGRVSDQFWLDEKNGKLRVASIVSCYTPQHNLYTNETIYISGDTYNKVYCLGDALEIIGESEQLGLTEEIKSVKYIGDIAYVVTFRQTDPLYAIDLSDASSPKTLSELKINGFSSYMQSYGDGRLLGIGYEAEPDTGVETGIKLTMFDTSDPSNITEISTCSYLWSENGYSSSEATYNHKALLIDSNKGIIAIPMVQEVLKENEWGDYGWSSVIYFIFFEFDGKTLTEKGRIQVFENDGFYWNTESTRGLYIGGYGYVVSTNGITSISLDNLNVISKLAF